MDELLDQELVEYILHLLDYMAQPRDTTNQARLQSDMWEPAVERGKLQL